MMTLAATTINIDAAWIAAFFAGLVGLVGAVVAGYVKIRAAQKESAVERMDMRVEQKQIHNAVNDNMSKALDKIDELHNTVSDLKEGKA